MTQANNNTKVVSWEIARNFCLVIVIYSTGISFWKFL